MYVFTKSIRILQRGKTQNQEVRAQKIVQKELMDPPIGQIHELMDGVEGKELMKVISGHCYNQEDRTSWNEGLYKSMIKKFERWSYTVSLNIS